MKPAITAFKRYLAANAYSLAGKSRRNRRQLYGGGTGLRLVALHELSADGFRRFKKLFLWCKQNFVLGGPEDIDAHIAGTLPRRPKDTLVFTFDDGFETDFAVAEWLQEQGVKAVFFVVPSLIDRTITQFREFHRSNGIEPYGMRPARHFCQRGLSRNHLKTMLAAGHRVGCHNFAHRNLGELQDIRDLHYEIDNGLTVLAELTGRQCDHFAFAFGRAHHVTPASLDLLYARQQVVYSAVPGLNTQAAQTRIIYRNGLDMSFPLTFMKASLNGSMDGRSVAERAQLA
jgi:peptidoglycan/xylan/chitin deacetylase (PgdA/CDA1 family)